MEIEKKQYDIIKESIEYEQPLILILKSSISKEVSLKVVKALMKSPLPPRVVNYKKDGKNKGIFEKEIKELKGQIDSKMNEQWVLVFKTKDEMECVMEEIGQKDLIDDCLLLDFENTK